MIFFTSDQHFDHAKIIKYCKRPFSNVDEMDSTMIRNWNSVVTDNDIVYQIGDFTLGENYERYLNSLNGNIVFVVPVFHHDKKWIERYYALEKTVDYVQKVNIASSLHLIEVGGIFIHMCHYPVLVWDRKHYGSWNLYGHVHNKDFVLPGFSYNVGVDHNNFTPVSFTQVKTKMESMGWTKEWREFGDHD
jgi:calcineurin-like phosphoesterase family protein